MDNSAAISIPEKAKTENHVGRVLGKAALYLILLVGAVIFIFPFFWMISNSLMTLGETITRQLLPKVPQWINYKEAWDQANFSKYFLNSVLVTLGTLTGLLFTSILAGYAFGRIDFKGKICCLVSF
jgi:ABC-type sugar transport system, permease component